MSNMRVTLASLLCGAAASLGYVGQWHSYTNMDYVACMQLYHGRVYAGTQGGIRSLDPENFGEKRYNNLDGLLEAGIVAMAITPSDKLWAASRGGFLYEFDGARWQAYGRSYYAENWKPNKRALLANGNYLAMGTQKGLTFFDVNGKYARVNLTKFRSQGSVSVLSLLRKDDTLFIGTEAGAFKAAVDWNDLLSKKYPSIFDPNIWTDVSFPPPDTVLDSLGNPLPVPPPSYNTLAVIGGTLHAYSNGMIQDAPDRVEAFSGQPLRIHGKDYPLLTSMEALLQVGNKLFLGGQGFFGVVLDLAKTRPDLTLLQPLPTKTSPLDTLINVAAAGNSVYGLSSTSIFRFDGDAWNLVPGYFAPSPDISYWHLRNLSTDGNGSVFVGSWGQGIIRVKNGQAELWTANNVPCMDSVLYNFTVVYATSSPRNGLLWATLLKHDPATDYSLVYFDQTRNQASCTGISGNGKVTHKVRALSDTSFAVASEAGIDLYKYARSGSSVSVAPWKSLSLGASVSESWDAGLDAQGRVWGLMVGKLVYADSLNTGGLSDTVKTVDGFNGKDCHMMDGDNAGRLWIGCADGLYKMTPASVAEASQFERFSLDDGLLSNNITDLAVNKDDGRVWVATDIGVSVLEGDGRPAAPTADDIKVYPNPFRPQHRFVVFDHLPGGASVRIHNESGSVVRSFPSSQIKGGQCLWDGNNNSGNKVSPGVYLYSVDTGGKSKHGKIIVAR